MRIEFGKKSIGFGDCTSQIGKKISNFAYSIISLYNYENFSMY